MIVLPESFDISFSHALIITPNLTVNAQEKAAFCLLCRHDILY